MGRLLAPPFVGLSPRVSFINKTLHLMNVIMSCRCQF